jgi:DNA-binding IclR family transcriptional regulator
MPTSDRALAVLKLFSLEKPVWTASEAAATLGVSSSTAYRYISALDEVGLVASAGGGKYTLGPAIIQFDRQIQLTDPVLCAARPVMNELVEYAPAGSVVLLCRPFRNSVLCVHQVLSAGPQPLPLVSYERGRPMPMLRGATSKAILAYQPLRELKRLYAGNEKEAEQAGLGHDWDEFRATLGRMRKDGFVITHADVDRGRIGIAAPILDQDRKAIGSLSYVVPESTDSRTITRLTSLVMGGAREIEAELAKDQPGVSSPEVTSR